MREKKKDFLVFLLVGDTKYPGVTKEGNISDTFVAFDCRAGPPFHGFWI